jgi:hypothetical protein
MRRGAVFLAAAAFALIGADEPAPIDIIIADTDPTSAKFAESTQTPEALTAAIEKRGWTEYPQRDPEVAKVLATFSRSGSSIHITVSKVEPKCNVTWSISSPDDPDAVLASAYRSVSERLSASYPGGSEALNPPTPPAGRAVHQFVAGDSVGQLGVFSAGGLNVAFRAINTANLE